MLPLPRAVQATGLSRSGIYRAAARGQIRLVKCGRTTMVDMVSVREFIAGLPRMVPAAAREGRADD